MSTSVTKIFLGKSVLCGNTHILMSSCLLPSLMKMNICTFENVLTNYSKNTTKKTVSVTIDRYHHMNNLSFAIHM